MSSPRSRAVIIGGGIAGLAAAHRLRQLAPAEALRITLIERDERLGGKLLSQRPDGFVIEAGPDSFLASKPEALRLAEELGLGDRVINTRSGGGGTFILCRGALEPLPEGFSGLVPTKLGPLMHSRLLGRRGKLRLQLEPWIPPRRESGDESVADFMRRRLGSDAFNRIAQPLLSGIYAGDAEQLSLLSTFPQLREQERRCGSLLRAMRARRPNPAQRTTGAPVSSNGTQPHPPVHRTPFLSLQGGIGELTDRLAASLDDVEVRLGVAVESIGPAHMAPGYRIRSSDGTSIEADSVLLATPAWASASMLDCLAPELARVLNQIPYVSTATISLAYRRRDLSNLTAGRGFVIPAIERRELTAVTIVSDKFAGRAPDDTVLVRCFVGRAGREEMVDLPDSVLTTLVKAELREILGIRAKPSLVRIYRWPRAMPQYTLGHPARLTEIEHQLANLPGLHLLGAAYRGVGIPDCIRGAYQAAEAARAELIGRACATDDISEIKLAHVAREAPPRSRSSRAEGGGAA